MDKPMKYRKKPVVIEAMKFFTTEGSASMTGIVSWINHGKLINEAHAWHNGTIIYIQTLEGTMIASVVNWKNCGHSSVIG